MLFRFVPVCLRRPSIHLVAPLLVCAGLLCASAVAETEDPKPVDFPGLVAGVVEGEIVLKGAMVTLTSDDMELMKAQLLRLRNEYGANHIRINTWPWDGLTLGEIADAKPKVAANWREPDGWVSAAPWEVTGRILKERWLPFFKQIGLGVILNLDAGPGVSLRTPEAWADVGLRARYVDYVVAKARFFSDCDAVIGYDVLNEPIPPGSYEKTSGPVWLCWDWQQSRAETDMAGGAHVLCDLYNDIIARIREFDQKRLIIVQPGPYGAATGFPQLNDIVDDPRVVFSFHIYDPMRFTHDKFGSGWKKQDATAFDVPLETYPCQVGDVTFDRNYLEALYAPAAEFQALREQKTGHFPVIWIGELGNVRWTDKASQVRWYRDVFSIINEHHWSWAYFLYAPWHLAWHPFSPFGPEGEDLDLQRYLKAGRNHDAAWFRKFDEQGPRPSFQIVIDQMRQQSPRALPRDASGVSTDFAKSE